MIGLHAVTSIVISLFALQNSNAITSPIQPYTNYKYNTELQNNIADLWWTVNETTQDIIFELHIKTTGWIALGISPAGGMKGADIGLGWVDRSGQLHFQDRYASTTARPMVDNTTTDWFGLRGREADGWTAIQFTRALDTCDIMDVAIKSGTNILIFAYSLEDPDMSEPSGIINYHETRRGSRIIPLRSYANPPAEEKFTALESFDFKLDNYIIPTDPTTYHCKIYKVPTSVTSRRHTIAHKIIVTEGNEDIVHHLLMYECDPMMQYDDDNLPDGLCDDIGQSILPCIGNAAAVWAVGGDAIIEFPEIAGYSVGGDDDIKYFMVQTHYDNPSETANRLDSSGIRFYFGNEFRQYDLGYFTVGADASPTALAIPPQADQFIVDSYCPASATSRFPQSGITVFAAMPHTHLQGRTVWTKIIRNETAVDYLFNGAAFDFNYQFQNRFPEPIKLYPGDELATRCIYSTTNKNVITLGGEGTKEEMCLHFFTYYPRMTNISTCLTRQSNQAWMDVMNSSSFSSGDVQRWLLGLTWTQESRTQWQMFYNNAPRTLGFGRSNNYQEISLPKLPEYKDLKEPECKRIIFNTADNPKSLLVFVFLSFVITMFFN